MLQVGTSRRWPWPTFSNRRANLWWGVPTPHEQVNEPAPESQSKGASHPHLTTRETRPTRHAGPSRLICWHETGSRKTCWELCRVFLPDGQLFLVFPYYRDYLGSSTNIRATFCQVAVKHRKISGRAHPCVRPTKGGHTDPPLHQNEIRVPERRPAG